MGMRQIQDAELTKIVNGKKRKEQVDYRMNTLLVGRPDNVESKTGDDEDS